MAGGAGLVVASDCLAARVLSTIAADRLARYKGKKKKRTAVPSVAGN